MHRSGRHIEFDLVIYIPFRDEEIMGERMYLDVNSITGLVAPIAGEK